MDPFAIRMFGSVGLKAGMAFAVLIMGVGSPSNLHAASSTAAASATVIAPVAVTAGNPQLRFQSAHGTGDPIVTGSGALSYTVMLESVARVAISRTVKMTSHVTSPSTAGALMAGTQTLAVTASLASDTVPLAGPQPVNFSVMVTFD